MRALVVQVPTILVSGPSIAVAAANGWAAGAAPSLPLQLPLPGGQQPQAVQQQYQQQQQQQLAAPTVPYKKQRHAGTKVTAVLRRANVHKCTLARGCQLS